MDDKLVDLTVFGAAWCANCKTVKQFLEAEGTAFAYIDVDSPAGKAMAQDYNVRGLPVAYYKGDRVFHSVASCKDWLRRNGSDKHPRAEARGYEPRPVGLMDLMADGDEDRINVVEMVERIRAENEERRREMQRVQQELVAGWGAQQAAPVHDVHIGGIN